MALLILRCVFVLVAVGAAISYINTGLPPEGNSQFPGMLVTSVLIVAAVVIAIDILVPKKRIEIISTVYFGTLIGFFLTYIVSLALVPLIAQASMLGEYREVIQVGIGIVLCYMCISVLMQTKDDFRFIIPYVEFSKEIKGLKPFILDTSVIIDGVHLIGDMLGLDSYADKAFVAPICLEVSDRETFKNSFALRASESPLRPVHRYITNLDQIIAIQNHLIDISIDQGIPVVPTGSIESLTSVAAMAISEKLQEQKEVVRILQDYLKQR